MSEEASAVEETVIDDAAPAEDAASIEDEAREMGWKPRGEFKGDESNFIDAAEFVRRGKEFVPFLRANNAKLEKEVQGLKKTLKQFGEFYTKTEQRAYERALKDLEARQAEAVEANDVQAVREITKEISDLEKDARQAAKSEPADDAEAFEEWKAENAWFDKDKALRGLAIAIAEEIKHDFPDPVKQRAEIARRVKAEMPEKFTNPRRTLAPAVEGVGKGPKTTGKSYSDLPPDAKKMCDEFVRDIPGFTRDKYVKDYFQ